MFSAYENIFTTKIKRNTVDFFIILLIPTPLVLALFLQQHPYFSDHFKCFLKYIPLLENHAAGVYAYKS